MRLYLLPLLFVLIIACEEVEDPASEVRPPSIKVDFVPDATYRLNTVRLNKSDSIADTLFIIRNKLIEMGDPDSVLAIEAYEAQLEIKDSLSAIDNQFRNSRARIDEFIALGGNFIEEYQDTINSVFALPLNIKDTSSTFVFDYYDLRDTITFSYKTNTTYNLDKIIVQAFDLQVVKHTFDSLSRHYCQTDECTSGEITFKVYF